MINNTWRPFDRGFINGLPSYETEQRNPKSTKRKYRGISYGSRSACAGLESGRSADLKSEEELEGAGLELYG
jgi:hypothetical protein